MWDSQPVEKPEKVYDVAYLQIYKKTCDRRPRDMRVIEVPLRSKGAVTPVPEEEPGEGETAESIRNIRILLNKLSKDNFARISDTILNNFAYNKEILEQLTVGTETMARACCSARASRSRTSSISTWSSWTSSS